MNFEFSEEQDMLREQAQGFLSTHCPPSVVRKVLEGEESFDADLWGKIVEMGIDPWGARFDDRSLIGDVRARSEEVKFVAQSGDEVPAAMNLLSFHCTQSAPKRDVFAVTRFTDSAKLNPGVAQPILMFSHKQVPIHALGRIAVGLDAV